MTTKFDPDRQAKTILTHIEKAEKYQEKAVNNEISAALLLIEAKEKLGHGNYTPWLELHGIAQRTASRLIAEHMDPAKRAARMTQASMTGRKERAKAAKAEKAEEKAEKAAAVDPIRTEVLRIIGGLDAPGIEDVHEFLQAQGYANEPDADDMSDADDMEMEDAAYGNRSA